jgi:hypothetical protein
VRHAGLDPERPSAANKAAAELEKRAKEAKPQQLERERERDRNRDAERNRDRNRDAERDRDRDRDVERDRNAERERDRARERGGERDRAHEREQDRERGRHGDRERERERLRDRERERERDGKRQDGDTQQRELRGVPAAVATHEMLSLRGARNVRADDGLWEERAALPPAAEPRAARRRSRSRDRDHDCGGRQHDSSAHAERRAAERSESPGRKRTRTEPLRDAPLASVVTVSDASPGDAATALPVEAAADAPAKKRRNRRKHASASGKTDAPHAEQGNVVRLQSSRVVTLAPAAVTAVAEHKPARRRGSGAPGAELARRALADAAEKTERGGGGGTHDQPRLVLRSEVAPPSATSRQQQGNNASRAGGGKVSITSRIVWP